MLVMLVVLVMLGVLVSQDQDQLQQVGSCFMVLVVRLSFAPDQTPML